MYSCGKLLRNTFWSFKVFFCKELSRNFGKISYGNFIRNFCSRTFRFYSKKILGILSESFLWNGTTNVITNSSTNSNNLFGSSSGTSPRTFFSNTFGSSFGNSLPFVYLISQIMPSGKTSAIFSDILSFFEESL